jgi:hypothetical protein
MFNYIQKGDKVMKKETRSYCIEKRWFNGDYGQSKVFSYMGYSVKLNAGLMDDLHVYRDGNNFVILTTNNNHDYAGLEYIEYHPERGLEITHDIFFQDTNEIPCLNKPFYKYHPNNQAAILMEWVQ